MGMPVARFTSSVFDHDPTTTITIDVALAQLLRRLRFLRLDPLHRKANQTVQRTGASRHADWRSRRRRWLDAAPTFNVALTKQTETSMNTRTQSTLAIGATVALSVLDEVLPDGGFLLLVVVWILALASGIGGERLPVFVRVFATSGFPTTHGHRSCLVRTEDRMHDAASP